MILLVRAAGGEGGLVSMPLLNGVTKMLLTAEPMGGAWPLTRVRQQ